MATQKSKKQPIKRIFISWAGSNSKEIALGLKNVLENTIFNGSGLTCFVSTVDISSGAEWWSKINGELKKCKMGICCITKENIRAPWIYYEAGALAANGITTIPLLISCNIDSIAGSPFTKNQCIEFYNRQAFIKMILDINEKMEVVPFQNNQLTVLAIQGYDMLRNELSETLLRLTKVRFFNSEKYVYPKHISTIEVDTIFISAPMSTISQSEYNELKSMLQGLEVVLKEMGMRKVICPLLKSESGKLDGKARAIKNNFSNLKQVDSMLVIYPHNLPTSALVEIGYGIALCKKMVIFYKESLPYILDKAGENINHIRSYKYDSPDDIIQIIQANGMDIFDKAW